MAGLVRSAFALPAELFEELDLDLLNLEEAIVLTLQEVIDLFASLLVDSALTRRTVRAVIFARELVRRARAGGGEVA